MHIVIYSIIVEDGNNIDITGPYFYGAHHNQQHAEALAKEVTNSRSKDVIISRIMARQGSETVPDIMMRARDTWFPKFRERTMNTVHVINRDVDAALCPFQEIKLREVVAAVL